MISYSIFTVSIIEMYLIVSFNCVIDYIYVKPKLVNIIISSLIYDVCTYDVLPISVFSIYGFNCTAVHIEVGV